MKKNTKTIDTLRIAKIYKTTFAEYKKDFWTYIKIVSVVAVPAAIYNALNLSGSVGDLGVTFAIAWSFAFVALISYALKNQQDSKNRGAKIYVNSSARILPFIMVSVLLLLAFLPFLLAFVGIILYLQLGFFSPLVLFPLGLVGIVFSVYFLVALSVAQSASVDGSTAIESIKKSFRLTKKRRLKVFLAYFILTLLILSALFGIQALLSINQSIRESVAIQNIVYLIEACLVVPILVLFQVKLYEVLNAKR